MFHDLLTVKKDCLIRPKDTIIPTGDLCLYPSVNCSEKLFILFRLCKWSLNVERKSFEIITFVTRPANGVSTC